MSPEPSAAGTLNKQEKGRLKKLRKRANAPNSALSFSGINDVNEWHELLDLARRVSEESCKSIKYPGVHVNWKNGSQREGVIIESTSHRDLLAFLTRQVCESTSCDKGATNLKRKRETHDAATNKKPPSSSFEWISIHNKAMLQQLCILEIQWQGDEPLRDVVDRIHSKEKIVVPTRWFQATAKHPQDMTEALMYRPNHNEQRDSKKPKLSEHDKATHGSDLFRAIHSLRLTPQQMRKESYPLSNEEMEPSDRVEPFHEVDGVPTSIDPNDCASILSSRWITLNSTSIKESAEYVWHDQIYQPRDKGPKIFALDCEMVETTAGTELGRATLCQLESYDSASRQMMTNIVFDVFVRPQNPVVDYKTKWSGLTAKLLNDPENTVSLEQIQACVMQKVHPQDILVGHSLENDLHSMRWIHPTVVDTAILFRRKGRNTSKCSLEFLARQLLKKTIQAPDKPHCSEEDALAALELAVRRAVHGKQFDIAGGPTLVNWFAQYSEAYPKISFVGIACNKWLQKNIVHTSTTAHAVVTSADINAKTGKTLRTACTKKSSSRVLWASVAAETIDSIETVLAELKSCGLLVVGFQAGVSSARKLTEAKRLRQRPQATLQWNDANETELQEAMNTARNGYVVYIPQQLEQSASTVLLS